MSWADNYIQKLNNGETIQFRPRGHSMTGIINDNQLVHVAPITKQLLLADIVLCKVKGSIYLHLIKAINNGRYLIGNNRGKLNGWTSTIYGVVTKIEK